MVRTKIQRVIFVLLLLLVAILFSACSQVTIMTVSNDDGTIDELVSVNLDRDKILDKGYDIDIIKRDIERASVNEAKQIVYQFNSQVQSDMILNLNPEAQLILASYMNGIDVIGNKWEEDSYHIGIRFKNIDVYRYYYGITEAVAPTMETEEHFLYDKVSYKSYTMYVNYTELYNRLNIYFTSKYPEFNLTDTQLVYTYVSDSGRQHSDADYIVRSQGKYYHSWVVEDGGKIINFYYKVANRSNWILVCITISLGITLIVGIVALINNKLKKKKINIKTQ